MCLYVQREVLYAELNAFIRVSHGTCISAGRDLRLYRNETHWVILVPLPREFTVDAIRDEGLDALLDGSELNGSHHSSLVKYSVGRAAFDIDCDGVRGEAEYIYELFCLYEYETGRLYRCDDQAGGYVSSGDCRTYRAFDERLQPSAMSFE